VDEQVVVSDVDKSSLAIGEPAIETGETIQDRADPER